MRHRSLNRLPLLSVCGLTGLVASLGALPAAAQSKPTFTYQPLGTLGGATSTAEGVNQNGEVVGMSDTSGGARVPFVWDSIDGMQDLNAALDGPLDGPADLRFGPDRNGDGVDDLYVLCRGIFDIGGSVSIFDGVGGQFVEQLIPPESGGLTRPANLCIGPDGDFYLPSKPTGTPSGPRTRILKFDGSSGNFIGEFVSSTNGGPSEIGGLTFGMDQDDDGTPDLFVATEDAIEVYSGVDGVHLGKFVAPGVGGLEQPSDIGFLTDLNGDGVDDLFVSSASFNLTGDGEVLGYDGVDGTPLGTIASAPSGTSERFNKMALGPDGELFVIGTDTNQVYRLDGATGELEVFVAAGYGGLQGETPFLTFDAHGDLLVVSENSNQVLKYEGPLSGSPGTFVEIFVTGTGFILNSARDINNMGQIVGTGFPLGRRHDTGQIAAYRYTPPGPGEDLGTVVDLNLPALNDPYTADLKEATAINDDGDIAGHLRVKQNNITAYHAFLWREETGLTILGMLPPIIRDTCVTSISNRDGSGNVRISGWAGLNGRRAWRYDTATGVMQDLGLISGTKGTSEAWDVNDGGVVVGTAAANNKNRAFTRTLTGSMVDLGTLGGNESFGRAIDPLGNVVGTADTTTKASTNKHQAFLRTSAHGMFKLEPQITNLPAAMQLKIRPNRINQYGQIVGPGPNDPAGQAYILTPQ